MTARSQRRCAGEQGFTLIELLVVILIIGILAAIAIPSFLAQKGKASDTSAKEVARTARMAASVYATDHGNKYEGMTAATLKEYEPTLQTAESSSSAYLSTVTVEAGNEGFTVTAKSPTGRTFSMVQKKTGETERTCTPTGLKAQQPAAASKAPGSRRSSARSAIPIALTWPSQHSRDFSERSSARS